MQGDSWVVVGLDNGGPRTTPPCWTPRGVPRRPAVETRAGSPRGRTSPSRRSPRRSTDVLAAPGSTRSACGPWASTRPGPAERRRRHLVQGSHQLRPPRVARLRRPRRAREARSACPSSTTTTPTRRRCTPTHALRRRSRRSGRRSRPSSAPAWAAASSRRGRSSRGAAGMAGELGHVHIPMDGLLEPASRCRTATAASRRCRERRLAHRHREQPPALLAHPVPGARARQGEPHRPRRPSSCAATPRRRPAGARGSSSSRRRRSGRLFTIAANFTDPDAYFVGGGVVEAAAALPRVVPRRVREHTVLRDEQAQVAQFAVVPDLDMAGARGSAIAALERIHAR